MKIATTQVLMYLGYKNQEIDRNIIDLIEECSQEVISICKERVVYEVFDIQRNDEQVFLLGSTLVLKDTDIINHLSSSKRCLIMAATLGIEVDSKIAYYSKFNITKGLIMDACATTAIESLCDEVQGAIKESALVDNLHITNRYSPGYGSFLIENQRNILNILNAYKKIGLSVTESSIMLPRESVTALIGLGEIVNPNPTYKCNNCKNENCNFRKDGRYCGSKNKF
ncbi:vitamin B12 dependent-methionine synthase activation domain-containing protein [Clostridium sp.]|jgi:hypothetical protein|uniref:vitamin B12 dependent-methionine synthase activation domain-containing protein n=1 Tax=Clostridium sp. TaxID=1506 RepID=UPI003EE9F87A